MWVVDTTNEVRGDNAVRYLLPAAALYAITLNAPSLRLSLPHPCLTSSCTAALKALFRSTPAAPLRTIIDSSHGDLRQMCLKLQLARDPSALSAAQEDAFWGLFHMVKKMLLGKRRPDGRLENDYDAMFRDNAITVDDALEYVHANMPTYTSDLDDYCAVLEDLACVEALRPQRGVQGLTGSYGSYGSRGEEGSGEDEQSLRSRVRFLIAALSPAAHNEHLTAAARSFTAVAGPLSYQLREQRLAHRQCAVEVLERLRAVEECRVPWREFVLLYPSLLLRIHQSLVREMKLEKTPVP